MITAEEKSSRTRVDTEDKLIAATAELLGEVGPRSLSVRAIAERAGVNHGLVHHYFGGKDALLQAAMERLVHSHHDYAMEQSRQQPIPAPLTLIGDPMYLRAVVRAVVRPIACAVVRPFVRAAVPAAFCGCLRLSTCL